MSAAAQPTPDFAVLCSKPDELLGVAGVAEQPLAVSAAAKSGRKAAPKAPKGKPAAKPGRGKRKAAEVSESEADSASSEADESSEGAVQYDDTSD